MARASLDPNTWPFQVGKPLEPQDYIPALINRALSAPEMPVEDDWLIALDLMPLYVRATVVMEMANPQGVIAPCSYADGTTVEVGAIRDPDTP